MFASILSALGMLSGITGQVFGWLTKRADVSLEKYKVDGQVDQTLVSADVELIKAQRDLALAQNPYRGYRYLHYLFGYPLGVYWCALLFDKVTEQMPFMAGVDWDVLPLSSEQTAWAAAIVGTLGIHSALAGKWR